MEFKNQKDKEMYCFLLILQQFASGEITQGAFMQYIDDHTPEEYKGLSAHDNRSRAEVRQQIIDNIEKIQEHIRSTYFGGVRS